jgi:hypothetical protein
MEMQSQQKRPRPAAEFDLQEAGPRMWAVATPADQDAGAEQVDVMGVAAAAPRRPAAGPRSPAGHQLVSTGDVAAIYGSDVDLSLQNLCARDAARPPQSECIFAVAQGPLHASFQTDLAPSSV